MVNYASLKFRPAGGNISDFNIASASAFPLMRIEEMYFIAAEAAAHQNASQGKELLESFMKQYRYNTYACDATSKEDVSSLSKAHSLPSQCSHVIPQLS